jgi:hypothetical protein
MDFRAFAAQELGTLAAKLADAAKQQEDAATARQTASFQTTIERLRVDYEQVVAENERLTAENAALVWERDDLQARFRFQQRHPTIAALSAAFDGMSLGSSVEDVVVATAGGLTDEFARVVAFTINEGRFELRYSSGFDGEGAGTPLTSDRAQAFLADAIQHPGVHQWGPQSMGGTPFGGSPAVALTAPLVVRGDTVAVIYADDSGAERQPDRVEESTKIAEMLRRHAMLALERLTIDLKAAAELRAYAKMLLDEVEYVYEADLAAKMSAADRQTRMKENIRCARQIYGQRVAVEGPMVAALLDEQISHAIAEKARTPFGQDLAAVTAGSAPVAA